MTDQELTEREEKYFNIIKEVIEKNLASILNQCYSQNMQNFIAYGTANEIEHALENIVESTIAKYLGWPICSVPIASDSCFECGDAIVYLDAKTLKDIDGDATTNKVTLQQAQTSYDSSSPVSVAGHPWKASVPHYANHTVFGTVPNLTYVVKVIYSINAATVPNIYTIKEIQLISIPNGQLFGVIGNSILGAGRSIATSGDRTNIRFCITPLLATPNQSWRMKKLYIRA